MSALTSNPVSFQTDGVQTETSDVQLNTEAFLSTLIDLHKSTLGFDGSPPPLAKQNHVQFLARNLFGLPAAYVSLDASRPWMVYWILHSFDILGIALDEVTRERGVNTILACQHPSGGFGGNISQAPHLLPTYASVCSLAILGKGWDQIDRQAIYNFFMRMKRPNGGFTVCDGGEVDVRGVYCLLVTATLLDLLTPELVHNTGQFIASCQTFEGGFSASPSSISSCFTSKFLPPGLGSVQDSIFSTPLGEAHGGYTSCALLSLHLLRSVQPNLDLGVDLDALLRWSVMMQASAADGGGFKGRSNKLVDGCYGWWVGGSFAVLEQELAVGAGRDLSSLDQIELFDRRALQEYILLLAQHSKGGLADKPPKKADFYHTANNLSGLSAAQHKLVLSPSRMEDLERSWRPSVQSSTSRPSSSSTETPVTTTTTTTTTTIGKDKEAEREEAEERRKRVFVRTLGWKESDSGFFALGGDQNRVNTTHPSINILLLRVEPFMRHFYNQPLDVSV
ncbi:Beta subunit of farnesyltransferase [Phaffia rhodozyma]|uniref:Protein farnesyltransferase subunit beta n=1 Tax=Phaffia rhodozyma TaxID=264483 RepID=A0A0F7SSU4_PHARH|nr:Beta subunit of farnesyltransferase [Phaffia rhodozyma]